MGKRYLKAIERAIDQLEIDASLANQHQIPVFLVDNNNNYNNHLATQQPLHDISSPDDQDPNERPLSPGFNSDSKTPFLNTRRHDRNYSATIKFQPANSTSATLSASSQIPGQASPEEDRQSSKGGLTFCETTEGEPLSLQQMRRTNTSGSMFSSSAFSHSSQLLRSLTRRLTILGTPDVPLSVRSIQVDENYFDSVLEQLLPEEREFFGFLEDQLEMINNFYREKELEAVTKLKVIKQQLYVANEWKRRYDESLANAEAERGWYAAEWTRVRKGINSFIRSDAGTTEDVSLTPTKKNTQIPLGSVSTPSSGATRVADSEQGSHYNNLHGLNSPLDDKNHHWKRQPTFGFGGLRQDELVLKEDNRRERFSHKVARTRIKAALYEFYRSLEMIRNYKVLNHTGFAKIMKKFDKTAKWKASMAFMNSKLSHAYFMASSNVDDLIKETEDVFVDNFEQGHRRRAMAKLRVPDSKSRTHHFATLRIGLYLGLAAPLLIQGVASAFSEETQEEIPYWDKLILVYAGLFLTISFSCLFGVNLYVWAKSRINYKFIFEFDPRDNLDYHEYFEIPILFMLILSLAVYLDFGFKLTIHVATAYWPLVSIIAMAAILFCPLPIARFSSRRWFLSSICRIIASGYYRVEFRDFFLADEMNSLTYSIEQFEFAICAYSHKWNNDFGLTCVTKNIWFTPFLIALPAWFRFLQCLRRYNDTHEWFPHLVNAGKYSASLITIFVNFTYRYYDTGPLKVAYLCLAIFTSIYTFVWDIYMDWGLFRFGKNGGGAHGHPFLRQELVYSKVWVYYLAIVLDLIGRFAWGFRFIPTSLGPIVVPFILALLEVLRRWMWNFFRLENEHLNNCGQFRAIKDIPLPFHIRVENDSERRRDMDDEDMRERFEEEEEEAEEEEEEENNSREYKPQRYNSTSRNDHTRNYSFSQLPTSSPESESSHIDSSTFGSNPIRRDDGSSGNQEIRFPISEPLHFRAKSHSTTPVNYIGGRRRPLPNERLARKALSQSDFSAQDMVGNTTGISMGASRILNDFGRRGEPGSNLFGNQHSTTFVDSAVAEAGFKASQLKAIESETSKSRRFYDRRDFDTKIIDSEASLRRPRKRSLTLSSLPILPRSDVFGPEGQLGNEESSNNRRPRDIPRRRQSIGTRFKSAIIRRPRVEENDDTE
ncbi:hypothetical protein BGZ76_009203 [Entomortierella beljakovae]|nr:hypothetical protein BGZ76_009203 [Entomortierella beljakovae]